MTQTSSIRADEPIKYVSKGWGYEKWIVNCEEYCGKLLFIAKGKRCSWHYHEKKDEVFYVQSGKISLRHSFDDEIGFSDEIILSKGDKFHVYRKHFDEDNVIRWNGNILLMLWKTLNYLSSAQSTLMKIVIELFQVTNIYELQPKSGNMVVFESRLRHEIPPNGGKNRSIMCYNFTKLN